MPRVPIAVRVGTPADLAFVDSLQKQHSRELGFLPRMALEGKVMLGQVLIAEVGRDDEARPLGSAIAEGDADPTRASPVALPHGRASSSESRVGYLIAADRYFKRDEVGYVTQINVAGEYRRSLVAAALLQAQFDRSARGCRLYCCWCAQDLKANEFWEAMGFAAIACTARGR